MLTMSNEESSVAEPSREVPRGHLAFVTANIYQAAVLNKLLPPGFKIDTVEAVQKTYAQKQNAMKRQAQKAKAPPAPFPGQLKSGISHIEEYKNDMHHKDDLNYGQPLVSPQEALLKNTHLAQPALTPTNSTPGQRQSARTTTRPINYN